MKIDEKDRMLSHIIINVDKNIPRGPISSFCTNVKKENPEIEFTYLCYDNQITGSDVSCLSNLISSFSENPDSLFIITDSEAVILFTSNNNLASAALYTDGNRNCSFSEVLYCIEDIELMSYDRIYKMWQRYFGIPWTIRVTDRLIIREQTIDDIPALYDIYSDEEASRYMEDLYKDPEEERDYLQKYIDNQYRFFEYGVWALTLKDSGKLIGRAGLSAREGYDALEIGYILGKPYRGQGYATEAVTAVMEYAEEELDVHDFIAFSKEKNTASLRLLESLGFTRKGSANIKGGKHNVYSLTKLQ